MKIIHFSDSHAGGPAESLGAYFDKRLVGVFNFKYRRQFQHNQDSLKVAVKYILDENPDIAICTGDLTSTGQLGEFQQSLDILQPLLDSEISLLYTPGNHDYYVHNKECNDALKSTFKKMNSKFNLSLNNLPAMVNIENYNFILINESWPSNLISSCGYLKRDSSEFIEKICNENVDKTNILIGHYPLDEDNNFFRWRHRLWGQKRVVNLLKSKKLSLSLCGHIHNPYAKINEEGCGEICSGSVTKNKSLALIEYKDKFLYKQILL